MKLSRAGALTLATLGSLSSFTKAQDPPVNDVCVMATSLLINGPTFSGSTVDATSTTTSGCGVAKLSPEVFFLVTGNGRRMKVTTCSSLTTFATALTIWNPSLCRGSCNQGSTSDPDCSDANAASVVWDSTEGGVYTLLVHGRQAGATGDFGISVTDFVNPPNDYCQQATVLPIDPEAVTVETTVNATTRTTSGCGATKQAPEVFFQVTGNGRRMTATTCTEETQIDTNLALWNPSLCRGSCNEGSSSDPRCPLHTRGARVTWDSTAGGVYTLVPFGRQAGSRGQIGISVDDFPNPVNDYCDQATSLVINGGVSVGSTVNATTRTTSGCGATKQAPEIFFQVTGNGRRMTATTCHDETSYATALALWNPSLCRGSCNQGSVLDRECDTANGARVTWDSTDGGVYTLVTFGRQADSEGSIAISVADFENPSNDYCVQATPLQPGGSELMGTTVNATTRTNSGCGVSKASPEVYYSVVGTGSTLTVTTCSASTDFATGLAVWNPSICRGSCNSGSVSDPSCGDANGAAITWETTANAQYTIVVFGRQAGATGSFAIRSFEPVETGTPASPPSSSPSSSLSPSSHPTSSPSSSLSPSSLPTLWPSSSLSPSSPPTSSPSSSLSPSSPPTSPPSSSLSPSLASSTSSLTKSPTVASDVPTISEAPSGSLWIGSHFLPAVLATAALACLH